jgi:hypothetical protein
MRLLKIAMPLVLAAGALFAQDKAPEKAQDAPAAAEPTPDYDAVIIPVKTLTGDSFERLVKLLQVFHARLQSDDKLRVIVVYAPKDVVEKMRKVVAALDQPGSEAAIGRNIDMTLTFLKCSTKAPAQPSVLPPDMEPVARQLRAATQCKDIELWNTLPLHLQEGKETQESLALPSSVANVPGNGMIAVHPEGVTRKDQGRYVRFSNLKFDFRIPHLTGAGGQYQTMGIGLTTSGDFMEGQKTVLGKLSGTDDDSAIFVVVELKVLD